MYSTFLEKVVRPATLLPAILFVHFLVSIPTAHAEYFGLPTGRGADISAMADKSVELGFVTGDIADVSYEGYGFRFNFKASPDLIVFGDIGKGEVSDDDGTLFGAGFLYQIRGVTKTNALAFKGTYHKANPDDDEGGDDPTILTVEVVLSGDKIGESDLSWYFNGGIHKFDVGNYDDTEIGFGGGIFMPTSFGEFYAGMDLIDEITFGLGVRYFLQ